MDIYWNSRDICVRNERFSANIPTDLCSEVNYSVDMVRGIRTGINTFRTPGDFRRICIRIELAFIKVHVCVFVPLIRRSPERRGMCI